MNETIWKEKKYGKGKEFYDTGELFFEGQFLNGKRNGTGKEYYKNGRIGYVGEYSNGKENGKGIEYYDNGEILFEGEYLKGIRKKGKLYNHFGELIKNYY